MSMPAHRYRPYAAVELPDCLRRTAVDESSGVTMAVAHKEKPLVGVQFHPESILSEQGAQLIRNFLSSSPPGRSRPVEDPEKS